MLPSCACWKLFLENLPLSCLKPSKYRGFSQQSLLVFRADPAYNAGMKKNTKKHNPIHPETGQERMESQEDCGYDSPLQSSLKNPFKKKAANPVWNRNFTLLMSATILGSIGAIASTYALSFLVYEETGSVFASALALASRLIPAFFLPLVLGPFLDRHKRKPVLVFGDLFNGILYLALGVFLLFHDFSYIGYLGCSLLLSCAGGLDELAFDSILPMTITPGCQQKSYAASGMVYPMLNLVMMPVAGLLMKWIGIPAILIGQGGLSLIAAAVESRMHLLQDIPSQKSADGLACWFNDLKQAFRYLSHEPGLMAFFVYAAFSNGVANACSPVLIAYFSITPGLSAVSFSLFSVAESLGRFAGNTGQYLKEMQKTRKYGFSLMVMFVYNLMDGILLLLPYPLMLANRFVVGALGATSYTLRTAAIQSYIPESMRGRINSFQNLLFYGISSLLMLIFGWIGDWMTPPAVLAAGAFLGMTILALTWVKHRRACQKIFLARQQDGSR